MGFVLREGRFLSTADSHSAQRVCVVDSDFANYYWPHVSAIGQHLWDGSETGKDEDAFTVVGVVDGAKQAGLTEDEAQGAVYYPYSYRMDSNSFVAIRTSLPPESFALALQKTVRQIDPNVPGQRHSIHGHAHRRQPRRAPLPRSARRALLRHRAPAHRHRHLRRAQLRRRATPPRNRSPHGSRRPPQPNPPPIPHSLPCASSPSEPLSASSPPGNPPAPCTPSSTTSRFSAPAILASAALILTLVCLAACLLPAQRAARTSPSPPRPLRRLAPLARLSRNRHTCRCKTSDTKRCPTLWGPY